MAKRKDELLKELQELETLEAERNDGKKERNDGKTESVSTPGNNTIDSGIVDDTDNANVQAAKKPRIEKQIEAFKKACETRKAKEAKRKIERENKDAEDKKILEEKLVKKAIAVKKKQIKKQQILDDISDDETNAESKNPITAPKAQKLEMQQQARPQTILKFY